MKILLGFAILLMTIGGYAQTKKTPRQDAIKPDRNMPLTIDGTKMPTNFQGNDPEAILTALQRFETANLKGEFETTAAYNARIESLKQIPYLGGLMPDSILGFVLPTSEISFNYDADKKVFVGVIPLKRDDRIQCSGTYSSQGLDCRTLTLVEKSKKTAYLGQNTFGATAKITAFLVTNIGLNFYEAESLPRQDITNQAYRMAVPIDPVKAISIKPNLRILFIGKLSNMNYTHDYSKKDATIQSPTQIVAEHFRLHFIVKEICAFNGLFGEIYGCLNQKALDSMKQ